MHERNLHQLERITCNMKTSKRMLSAVLAAFMAAGSVPMSAAALELAVEDTEAAIVVQDAAEDVVSEATYVMMNIPYAQFYKNDVNNDVPVDVFTSATKAKTKTKGLSYGSYHNEDGSAALGATYYVKLGEGVTLDDLAAYEQVTDDTSVDVTTTMRGQTSTTTFKGFEALYTVTSDYAYYVMSTVPSSYKVLTKNADGSFEFSATEHTVAPTEVNIDADFSNESRYGDYQLNLDSDVVAQYVDRNNDMISGVVFNTEEGTQYGMRTLENIWLGSQIAWCSTDLVPEVHGCPTSYAHYASMMGKTITSVTYYTDKGVYQFHLNTPVKVQHKYSAEVSIAEAKISAGSAKISGLKTLPKDFKAQYTVTDEMGNDVTKAYGFKVSGSALKFSAKKAKAGLYNVTISDKNGKYVDTTVRNINLTADKAPVSYKANAFALTGKNAAAVSAYMAAITGYTIDGTATNAPVIDTATGAVNPNAATQGRFATAAFTESGTHVVSVQATGYPTLTFKVHVKIETAEDGTVTKSLVNAAAPKIASVKAGAKKMTVKIAKVTGATYEISYSTSKAKAAAGTDKVIKTAKASKTIKKLKKGKKYYVAVRATIIDGDASFVSDWSAVKSVKIK